MSVDNGTGSIVTRIVENRAEKNV